MSGSNVAPIASWADMIQARNPQRGVRMASTSGAQRNLKTHGRTSMAVSAVIFGTDTPAVRRIVGKAHQMNPIGAPSLR